MFTFLKKKMIKFYSPVNGEIVPIEKVPDPVFSEKMMGEGIAIEPKDGMIHSPADGTIMLVSPTKHAIGIRTEDGSELLIHVGLETVSMGGKGFSVFIEEGSEIKTGQKLMKVDLDYIKASAKSSIIPIVITNGQDTQMKYSFTHEKNAEVGKTVLFTGTI